MPLCLNLPLDGVAEGVEGYALGDRFPHRQPRVGQVEHAVAVERGHAPHAEDADLVGQLVLKEQVSIPPCRRLLAAAARLHAPHGLAGVAVTEPSGITEQPHGGDEGTGEQEAQKQGVELQGVPAEGSRLPQGDQKQKNDEKEDGHQTVDALAPLKQGALNGVLHDGQRKTHPRGHQPRDQLLGGEQGTVRQQEGRGHGQSGKPDVSP